LGVGFGLAQLTCASLAFAGGAAAAAWRLRAFPDPVTLAVLASVGWIAAGRCYTTWSVESNSWAWLSFGTLGFCSAWLAGPTNTKWSRKMPLDRRLVFMLLTGFLIRGVWTLLNPCNGRGI
jgi:hypothetical protein